MSYDQPRVYTMTDDDSAVDELLHPDVETNALQPQRMRDAVTGALPMLQFARNAKRNDRAFLAAAKRLGARLGDDAYYRWTVRGKLVQGLTASTMRALAVEYGYVLFGVQLDSVVGDRIEVTAYALDLAKVVLIKRPAVFHTAPPPAKFAEKHDQRQRWQTMQMQSGFSKAVRGAIEQLLPPWAVAACMESAQEAAHKGILGGRQLDAAISEALQHWQTLNVTLPQLEGHVGLTRDLWTVTDLGALERLWHSLQRGETTLAAAFPAPAPSKGLADIVDEEVSG